MLQVYSPVLSSNSILEMFAEEAHTANTDAISSSYLEITTVTVAKQCTVPSTVLWKALRDASTAGGGKGSLPSYPAKVMDVYNGPRSFPVTSTTLSVPVTGSEVPDDVFLCVREQSNIATKRGSTAYLSLPDVKCASMTVATQGRHAFQHTGETPFSDSTSGVTSRASLDAKSATVKARYKEYFKDTVMKQMCIANGDDLNACNKYLYSRENWVNGNTIYVFHASTALSNDGGMKSLVYAAPFQFKMVLNAQLAKPASIYTVGYSNGEIAITQNGDILETRFSSGTDVSTALAARKVE